MKESSKSTIHDVARAAGVSIATVSRILNDKGGVSEELEGRIRAAIQELNYVPNSVARALKARRTKSLGLIIPTIENPVFPPLVKAIERTALEHGMSTFLCNSNGDVLQEARYLELLVEKQVDGIIFNAMGDFHQRFSVVRKARTPFLVIGRAIEGFRSTIVTIDNFRGGYLATEYLLGRGMRRIAFLFGYLESTTAINDRFMGYKQALDDNGLPFDKDLVTYASRSVEGGIQATESLLRSNVKFDAVFASNDVMAMGCIDKLIRSAIRVPDDVSVMGYDDIPFAEIFLPNLSTVRSPVDDLGREAVETIIEIVESRQDRYASKTLQPQLMLRESTI